MAEANDYFRAARERTASPTQPGMGLTRQELADLVNTWVSLMIPRWGSSMRGPVARR